MARTCRLVRGGRSVDAQWRRDGNALLISPAGGPPLAVALAEVSGIAGDGFTLRLRLPDGEVALERLGGDGPTLLQELRRDWPPLRAAALRLAGAEAPREVFAGTVEAPVARGSFRGFVADDRLILAVDGQDVAALFVADWDAVDFDAEAAVVRCSGWAGRDGAVFGKLGAAAQTLAGRLRGARETLARQAGDVLSRHLPTLGAAQRATLAGDWLPGRLLSLERLERLAPGFESAFRGSWLAASPRAACGAQLMAGLAPEQRHLGYAPPAAEDAPPDLWLLAVPGETASLELLSHGDYATYLFRSGPELPALVEGIVRLPEFSREALYLPLDRLTGEHAAYAIAARELPLLRGLRERFAGRKVHARGD